MKYLILFIKFLLNCIYFILKLLPTNNRKVVFISRQQNSPSLDFRLLNDEIKKIDSSYKVVILCKKMNTDVKSMLKYSFHLFRQMYHLATSRVCVVDSYSICVSILTHKKSLTVIQIWHAIATVKKFGYQTLDKKYGRSKKIADLMNMHNNYDWVISGSVAMVPIFAKTFNVSKSKVKAIGTPRVDYLINSEEDIRNRIKEVYPDINSKKVILYAPTFRRNKNINFDKIIETVNLDKYNLIIKTHPVKTQKIMDERIYSCSEFSTMELITVADYVITDYSAISIESAILNKPVYFYVYDYDEYKRDNGLNIDVMSVMKDCCYKNFVSLYKKIENDDYDYVRLKNFKDKYVTNQNGNSGYILANYIVNNYWLDVNKNNKESNESI